MRKMAAIELACKEYINVHHDNGLLLAAISDAISDGYGDLEAICETLLHPDNHAILKDNGWDLLNLFAKHIKTTDSVVYALVYSIIEMSSAREMHLALMEQLEMSSNVNVFIILLPLLQNVIFRVANCNISILLKEIHLFVVRYASIFNKKSLNDIAIKYKLSNKYMYEEEHVEETPETSNGVTLQTFAICCLDFLSSHIKEIHNEHCQTNGTVVEMLPYIQLHCIANLLTLLDCLMNQIDEDNALIERVMDSVIQCHYGAMNILEWKNVSKRGDVDEFIQLPSSGLAEFAYLLISNERYIDYLPLVVNPSYLYEVCTSHGICLMEYYMSHPDLTINGLVLLEEIQKQISLHSLSPTLLDQSSFQSLPSILCKLMIQCPFQTIRDKSLRVLKKFISNFSNKGRYCIYQSIMAEVDHSGVHGLVIHELKEEVHNSLKYPARGDDPFCGEQLEGFYHQFLSASAEMDVISQYEKLIGALNFLRFLLLRDVPSDNRTLIWRNVDQLQEHFLFPLRLAISNMQNYYTGKMKNPDQHDNRTEEVIETDVSVIGTGQLPQLSHTEQHEMLEKSLHKLDMMTSVLVRVEELCHH